MLLTVTSGARALAKHRLRCINPALAVACAMLLPSALRPIKAEIFITRPILFFRKCDAQARVTKNGPRRLVSCIRSQSSGVRASKSLNGTAAFHAALLTRISIVPNSDTI